MSRSWKPNRRAVLAATGTAVATAVLGSTTRSQAAPLDPTCTTRYKGYRAQDFARPYASFMAEHTTVAPPAVLAAYAGDPVHPKSIPTFDDVTSDLATSGYSAVETGYGQLPNGVVFAAVRTDMPRVTAAMWDWWFGWHSTEAARYKLWHPDAHLHASLRVDLTGAPIPNRQKYIGNTTYVDEYVGPKLQQLAIEFRDPVAHGFDVPADQTVIFGRVGSSIAPVDLGWLAHQVRPAPGGCEMRSRFYLNLRGLHVPNVTEAACAIARGPSVDPGDLNLGVDLARDLMLHCGQEMNHLARFLPELHEEFSS
ncbi:DAPG hydrolase family protein [Gordonia insulae]|uniref:Phloretin hydrolase n=1 Tax=Gordonia insulae TaxID=2420509 RepID=A0A3G8JHT0_9ACTN|nr:hypothetical protein [Gordonia insulae]AZG44573.1 Phloretin hydrolase [Gordonia insulae]